MSYLDNLYTPPALNESGEALDEGAIKNAKNWLKRNKYAIGGRALQLLGGANAGAGAAQLGVGIADDDIELRNRGLINGLAGAGLLYGGNKLMKKHKVHSLIHDIKHLNFKR